MQSVSSLYDRGVDYEELLGRVEGDHALLCELVSIFASAFPESYSRLDAAIQQGDSIRTREAAHAVKGMLGTLSIWRAITLAYEIETVAAAGSVQYLSAKSQQLLVLVLDAQRGLQELCLGGCS